MLDGVNGKLDIAKEMISELKDIGIETIQNKTEQTGKKMNREENKKRIA